MTMRLGSPAVLAGVVASALLGMAAGVGGFTFVYAKGFSYVTDSPEACANCHIMNDHYAAWSRGSHHNVAVCNDCHVPGNLVGKYLAKGTNGFFHSLHFTLGGYPYPLRITERNRVVTEQRCRDCHRGVVEAIDAQHAPGASLDCIRCHSSVGHLR